MTHRLHLDEPAICRIKIQGSLAQHWSESLGGLSISVAEESGRAVTTLYGEVMDQAALMGILNGLYGMGYPLLGAECQAPGRREVNHDLNAENQSEDRL